MEGHWPMIFRSQKILCKISYKDYNMYAHWLNRERPKMRRCDHILVGDEVEYLYKGKSYCDDCYGAVKKTVTRDST
jgi:hypothetical protein